MLPTSYQRGKKRFEKLPISIVPTHFLKSVITNYLLMKIDVNETVSSYWQYDHVIRYFCHKVSQALLGDDGFRL